MAYPTKKTQKVIDEILSRMSAGETLASICRQDGMPTPTAWNMWCRADEDLLIAHGRARAEGFDAIAEDALAIADDNSRDTIQTEHGEIMDKEWVARSKLRVETRLKLLAKWDPKRYGERLALAGDEGSPLNITVSKDDASL